MSDVQKKWLGWAVMVIAVIVAGYLGYQAAFPPPPIIGSQGISTGSYTCNYALGETGRTDCFRANNGYDISAYSGAGTSQTFTVDGATGNVTISGVTVQGVATLVPTNGQTDFNVSADLVNLNPAANVGFTLAACTSGRSAVLYNSTSYSIVITDTGNFQGAGNQTLGQYDTLPISCIDTKWTQTGPVSAN